MTGNNVTTLFQDSTLKDEQLSQMIEELQTRLKSEQDLQDTSITEITDNIHDMKGKLERFNTSAH